MTSDVDVVLDFVERLGVKMFPCRPNGRVPLTEHGFKDASVDTEQIRRWAEEYPGANWGMPTWCHSFAVLHIDVKHNKNGFVSLSVWEHQHRTLHETPYARTLSVGEQRYFRPNVVLI